MTYFVEKRYGNQVDWIYVGCSLFREYAVDMARYEVEQGFVCRIIEAEVFEP